MKFQVYGEPCHSVSKRIGGIWVLLCLLILVISCAAHRELKAVVPGETFEFKKSDVKEVNIGHDNAGRKYAQIYMTGEGNEHLYNLYSRHVGQEISFYFGDKCIIPDLYIAEPAKVSSFVFPIKNDKDEATALEIIKAYPAAKGQ